MKANDELKTGDLCTVDCNCIFVRYVDGSLEPRLRDEERVVNVKKGQAFPPAGAAKKPAWWKVQRLI